ncbi:MAG: GNAT family N-acetyltransferase [Algoriphagus sp.]|jgi:RimJ/RimL family protein N-acetyltransferase|nr:GNAT family N-acetyltransferase [Algoriphagus sp.]MCE2780056.1 GNAT family N-acetyltransferase [Algoriphagus sp.]
MRNTNRLAFLNHKSAEQLEALWENTFAGTENDRHVHAHVPKQYAVPNKSILLNFAAQNKGLWLIQRIEDNAILGYVVHGQIGPFPNSMGIVISRKFARQGYALETGQELLAWLKGEGKAEVFANCLESNIPIIGLLGQLGFEQLGPTGKSYDGVYELNFRKQL